MWWCFALFVIDLDAKDANQWYELNQNPTPKPSIITIFESSTLNLQVNDDFFKNNGAYDGDIAVNHDLFITSNLLKGDKSSPQKTTIYKNLTQGSTKNISGDARIALRITGDQQVKSFFDVNSGGNLVFDAAMSVTINNSQSLFSLFYIGSGGTLTLRNLINIDILGASAGFKPKDFKMIRPIFDISGGRVFINPDSKKQDVILKGDIYSIGELEANFVTKDSQFSGNFVFKDNSKTKLFFDQGSSAKADFNLRDSSEIEIKLDNQSKINGRFHALGSVKSQFSAKNQSVFFMDADFDWHSGSKIELLGGEWRGILEMAGDGIHTIKLENSGSFVGSTYLLSNAKLTLSSSNSSISGSISATGNTELKGVMDKQSKGKFNLTLIQNSKLDFSLDSQSQYEGKIKLTENSTSKILIDNGASFASEVTIFDAPNFSVQMQGGSTSKTKFIFTPNSAPKSSQIYVDNATFLGSITQKALDYAQVSLSNGAIWAIQASSKVNSLELSGNSVIDFTTTNFDNTQKRTQNTIDESNRILLEVGEIRGNNGNFNLYGILNRSAWGRDANGGIIATDKIITSSLSGTHNIKIFWDANHLDTTLLQANLYDDHIVVAEQNGVGGGGEFVGAVSDVGVYQYNTKLTKRAKRDVRGNVIGYEWILGEGDEPPEYDEPLMDPILEPESPISESSPEPPASQLPEPEPIISDPQPLVYDAMPDPQPELNPASQAPIPKSKLSSSAKLINTLLSSQYKIWHFQVENLHTRLGDLRNITTSSNVWAKVKYGLMLGEGNDELIDSKQMNTTLAFGADYSFYTPYGRNFIGGGFDVSFYQDFGGELDGSSEAYKGASTSFGVSVYNTFLFHNGIYIDSVLKYYYSSNEFSIALDELRANSPKFSHHALLASLEMGKKFRLPIPTSDFERSFYYLKPEVGVSVGYLMGADVEFSHLGGYVLNSTLEPSSPLQMRLGLDMGRRFDSKRVIGDVFIGFGGEYTALSKGDVKIASPINEVNLKSKGLFNLKVGVGGNVIFDDRVRMYFDVDSKFLGYIQPVLNVNVGVKVIFGERIKTTPRSAEVEQTSTLQGVEYIHSN